MAASIRVSSSFSHDESDVEIPSDDCILCQAKLDPINLVVNVKTRKITAHCVDAGCARKNRLGKWSFPSPVVIIESVN